MFATRFQLRDCKHARCSEVVVVTLQTSDIWTTASWKLCALFLSPLLVEVYINKVNTR